MSDTDTTESSGTEQTETQETHQPESATEWRAEAEKWKELAAKHERQAKENVEAARQLDLAEGRQESAAKRAEHKIAEAQKAAEEAAAAKVAETSQDATEWRTEAERWKQISREFEKQAKANANAGIELEKLKAAQPQIEAKAAETAAEAERRASEAEAKALRYEVAESMGVPKHLTDFLTGGTRKEIEQQADALLASIETRPKPELVDEGPSPEERAEADRVAEADRRAADAEAKALRYEVAAAKGLPLDLARFLNASTREELEKQTEVLLAVARKPTEDDIPTRRRLPQERLRSGAAPDLEPERSGDEIAAAILRRNRGY